MFIIHVYIYTHTSLLTLYRMQIVASCVCPELSILAATVPAGHPPEQSVWLKRDYEGEVGGRKDEGETRKTCGGRGTEVERWERHTPE